jgi:hypothetical protein
MAYSCSSGFDRTLSSAEGSSSGETEEGGQESQLDVLRMHIAGMIAVKAKSNICNEEDKGAKIDE